MSSYTHNFNEDSFSDSLLEQMSRFIGTTVTIYTTSGGESGCGVTGVLTMIGPCFVRLITCIGPAPCCSLGSSCNSPLCPCYYGGRRMAGGGYGYGNGFINNVGSVADIPIDRIAAFVHNAV
jgi:hypothetical protein